MVFNGKYNFTVECITSKGEVFRLEKNVISLYNLVP